MLKNERVYVTGNVIINNLDLLTYITVSVIIACQCTCTCISFIQVSLYSDKYLESQVFSVGTDPIGFFRMPPLPRNNSVRSSHLTIFLIL